ncbi:hypothetical protein [Pseudorhodoplanes sp.]|uniref:hypothetical protein n=1 Tax=Pseudorhodoplanes sp. TaxID=1934341 RepID=UPI003D0B8F87
MSSHVARSRVTKALTDANLASSFAAAEARLDAVRPCILLGATEAATAAGQTAALTAIVTARKCFGRVQLVGAGLDVPLLQPLLAGATIGEAAQTLGADVISAMGSGVTHLIRIGDATRWRGWQVSTWWDRWLAGTRLFGEKTGSSALALTGMFAGALAVRQIFAHVRSGISAQEATVSLWEPACAARPDRTGPKRCTIPTRLWLVGLGHLGQAFVWGLLALPLRGERYAVLQDDQWIGVENEPTSLLVGAGDIGARKVRVAARWLDHGRWTTGLIERRHLGDIRRTEQDPAILLMGLDDVRPRRVLAAHGFDYVIDAGIGHGATDFERFQIRVIAAGAPVDKLWLEHAPAPRRDRLMEQAAYAALEREIGQCGVVPLVDASVAVPFVGAATAALVIAQLARLGAMSSAIALLQLELDAPGMVIDGGQTDAPASFLGGETFMLD